MLTIPDTYRLSIAGHALDTAGTRVLNPNLVVGPMPRKRTNVWLPGYGWLARTATPDARAVDVDVFVDGAYSMAGTANTDPQIGAEETVAWLNANILKAPETAGSVAVAVAAIPASPADLTVTGRCQVNDMIDNGPTDGPERAVTFEVVILGELT